MPLIGLIPFLQFKSKRQSNYQQVCVNALNRAYPISIMKKLVNILSLVGVSMPLIGLIPFLQKRIKPYYS